MDHAILQEQVGNSFGDIEHVDVQVGDLQAIVQALEDDLQECGLQQLAGFSDELQERLGKLRRTLEDMAAKTVEHQNQLEQLSRRLHDMSPSNGPDKSLHSRSEQTHSLGIISWNIGHHRGPHICKKTVASAYKH